MKTAELTVLLRERFAAPEHAILFEVANGTGAAVRTYTDAVVMGLFPSRGLTLYGIEMKVSRGDWLRELKRPQKAEGIFRFMDGWYVAVGDEKIVHEGELPPTWGLLVAKDGKLDTKVKAPPLTAEPVTRPFLAAMLRRASEAEHRAVVLPEKEALARARQAGREEGRKSENEAAITKLTELQQCVAAFEAASGLKIADHRAWNRSNEKLGEAVKRLLDGEQAARFIDRDLGSVRVAAEHLVKAIDATKGASVPS